MSDFIERAAHLSPRRLLLLAGELQARLESLSAQSKNDLHAPVAVIGMAGRFPGSPDLQSYWDLLASGGDAIREIPADRWDVDAFYDPDPAADGKVATRWGGFIDDVFDFDPALFGITPREAISMDPQQRLILQMAWEALESAGIPPDSLQGSSTGVFVGACNSDYLYRLTAAGDEYANIYLSSGNAHSVISGRVSYLLGLQGPSLTVDTACSSSLSAIYLAIQNLRSRACRQALAGGVNAILAVETSIALSRARMMAADGRCKAFDAAADGFVRSEGCGLVVLKLLEDALVDGDPVLAVIRGAAMNQDGRSNGLTAPNGPSQTAVIRAALADAGINPSLVSYVETHGTGTSLGDPIEAQALGDALGMGRLPGQPLLMGSVKSNIGHLESAAGIASLIKLILMLQRRQIPPSLHFHTPNPHIPWEWLPLEVPTKLMPWDATQGRRIGGVSSFGFSGTNVHLLVEAPPERHGEAEPEASDALPAGFETQALALSAHGEKALIALTQRYALALESLSEKDFPDFCRATRTDRAALPNRLALTAESPQQAQQKLEMFLADPTTDDVRRAAAPAGARPETAFLFTGHGAQAAGMGSELYRSSPVYRQAFDRAAALFDAALPRPLAEIVYGDDVEAGTNLLNGRMLVAQAAMFCLQVGLAEVWRACGLTPSAVLGHSLGEYAAAWLAGVFGLEDAARLVLARGRLLDSIPAVGAMAAVFASPDEIHATLASFEGVEIAAMNGAQETVITGPAASVAAALDALRLQRVRSRRLAVTQAAHSAAIEPLLADFEAVARTVQYSEPELILISSTLGRAVAPGEATTAGYWCSHLRRTVRFVDGMSALAALRPAAMVEIGPAPVLLALGRRCLPDTQISWFPSLRPGQGDMAQMMDSLAGLWVGGCPVDWTALTPERAWFNIALPTYPFQQERFCVPAPAGGRLIASPIVHEDTASIRQGAHPLQISRLSSPVLVNDVFESRVGISSPPFLAHHRVYGLALLPSPAFLEMTLAAAAEISRGEQAVEDFSITTALVMPDDGLCNVQIVLDVEQAGRRKFNIYSQEAGRGKDRSIWTHHAAGWLKPYAESRNTSARLDIDAVKERCLTQIEADVYYDRLQRLGLEFGPSFRGLRRIWQSAKEALGEVVLPVELQMEAQSYTFHPAFLDACFHLLGAPIYEQGLDDAYLLIGIDHFRVYKKPGVRLWNHTVLRPQDNGRTRQALTADVRLYNDDGQLVAEALGLHLRLAQREALLRSIHALPSDWFYSMDWPDCPLSAPPIDLKPATGQSPQSWLIFADRGGVGAALAEQLRLRGDRVTLVERGAGFRDEGERVIVNAGHPEDFRLLRALAAVVGRRAVYCWGLDADQPLQDGAVDDPYSATLEACSALTSTLQMGLPGVWAVTRGAQPLADSQTAPSLAQSALWGLGRVAGLEQPVEWGGLIDLDPAWDAVACAEALIPELLAPDGEDAIAYRNGQRLVARLRRAPSPRRVNPAFRKDSAYMVTGGLGGLGLRLARWMAENGAGTLVLVGTSPLPERGGWGTERTDSETARRIAAIQAMEALGAVVFTPIIDVANAEAVSALTKRFGQDLPPLRGVIHAAARMSSTTLNELGDVELERTLRPKVEGAWNLHRATQDMDLDFFVLFSSTTALWGVEGLAAYAAANSFMDSLAHKRRRGGLPALSVNWGTWDVMRLASQEDQARYARFGLIPMEAGAALDCLGSLLAESAPPQLSVASVDWQRLRPAYEARRRRPLFVEMGTAPMQAGQTGRATRPDDTPPWVRQLAGVETAARRLALLALIRQAVAAVARSASPELIDPQQGLFEMGLDSLMSVELKGLLEKGVGQALPATLTFNYPTPADLAGYLETLLFPVPALESEDKAVVTSAPQTALPGTSELDDMSEDDLEALLEKRLKNIS